MIIQQEAGGTEGSDMDPTSAQHRMRPMMGECF